MAKKKPNYYAVARGRTPGIYESWDETKVQVDGFPGARHKGFQTREEAVAFIREHGDPSILNVINTPQFDAIASAIAAAERAANNTEQPSSDVDDLIGTLGDLNIGSVDEGLDVDVVKVDGSNVLKIEASDVVGHSHRPPEGPPGIEDKFVVFCDGSLPGNTTIPEAKGAIACIFPYHRDLDAVQWLEEATTNNRAEYLAAVDAMERANESDQEQQKPLIVYTSSKLLVDTMTKWVVGWQHNEWRKANGRPVENQDVIERLLSARGERSVEWRHISSETPNNTWEGYWRDFTEKKARGLAQRVLVASRPPAAA